MIEAEAASQTDEGTGNGTGAEVQKPTWTEQLPEDVRGNESLHGYKTIGDLAKAHLELSSERENLLKVPGEDATPEEKEAFAQKMGRPETVDGYEIGKPEGWPENIPYDEGLDANFKQVAFEMGLPANQVANLHKWYNDTQLKAHNEILAAEKAAIEKADNDLKDQWKGDAFKVNTEIAHRAFKQFGGEEAAAFLENAVVNGLPLGEHPIFRKLFYEVGKVIGDDGANVGESGLHGEKTDEQKARERFKNTKWD